MSLPSRRNARTALAGGLLSIVLGALGLVVALGDPTAGAVTTRTITVQNFAFSPARTTVGQGTRVTWQFQDNTTHTTTSDAGFWNSHGRTGGQSFAVTFTTAGVYGFHCAVHPDMTGAVTVPLRVIPASTGGWTVRWSSATSTPANRSFDVQVRRPGSSTWAYLRNDTTARTLHFAPVKSGKYVLRARTNIVGTTHTTGWTPGVPVTVG